MGKSCLLLFLLAFSLIPFPVAAIDPPGQPRPEFVAPPDFKQDDSFKTSLFTGAFTYNHQIKLPPGTNGLQPSVTLFYNHQKTNSLPTVLGAGWEISLSYIERAFNHTLYNFSDDSFKLVLGGSEFELVFSNADNRFHTKIETFLSIENLTASSNEMGSYWRVRSKDGKTYVFGSQNSSEMVSHTGLFATRWYLDSITDAHNNSIFHNYSENPFPNDLGSTYPISIQFNNDRKRDVQFIYETSDRPDIWKVFDASNIVRLSRRLKEIQINANDRLVRKYGLAYANVSFSPRSFLANITEFGNNENQSLAPIKFYFIGAGTGWTYETYYGLSPFPVEFAIENRSDLGVRLADANGDGLIDVLQSYTNALGGNTNKVFLNNGTGWVYDASYGPTPFPVEFAIDGRGDLGIRLADANGDGAIDLLQSYTNSLGANTNQIYLNNGTAWNNQTSYGPSPFPVEFAIDGRGELGVRLADANGDGLVDVLQSFTNAGGGNANTVYINNGTAWNNQSSWGLAPFPVEFAIDGRGDLGVRLADANGDGLVDVLQSFTNAGGGNTNKVFLNNGTAWNYDASYGLAPFPIEFAIDGRGDLGTRLEDANGDGLIDVLQSFTNYGGGNTNKAYLNNGSAWVYEASYGLAPFPMEFAIDGRGDLGVRLADANGDGSVDILQSFTNAGGGNTNKAYINNGSKAYLLNYSVNQFGGKTSVDYLKSTKLNNTGNDSFSDLPFNLWLVSSVTLSNSLNGSAHINSTTNYSYSGGVWSNPDREFKGFANANITYADGSKATHYFHQDSGRKGMEFRTETYEAANNPYLKKEYNFTTNFSNNYYTTHLQGETSFTFDGSSSNPRITNTTYSYDDYGNPLSISNFGENGVSGDEKYEIYQYAYNTSEWIMDEPYSHHLIGFDSQILRRTKYYYDGLSYGAAPHKGLLTKKEETLEGGTNPFTYYSYDSYGNLINTTDPLNRTTKFIYNITDSTFTFPEKTINALNHTTTSLYDLGTGNLLSTTDSNGFTTNYSYDNFSRLIKIIKPYDSPIYPSTLYEYEFDGIAPEKIKVVQREENATNNTYDSISFYDGRGNLIQTRSEAENNQSIIQDTFYDSSFRVQRKSNPYFATPSQNYSSPNASIPFSNITYDPLSRILSIRNPDNTTKSFNYSRWNTTTTDENGNQIKQVQDAYGQITEIHEFNSVTPYVTKYSYDAASQLLNITDNEQNTFKFSYDTLGRKTSLIDPDLGIWNYSYDAAGNLITQKDNRSTAITLQYDDLNRLIRINSTTESISFLYDRQLNGTLSSISAVNFSFNFSYDSRYRKTSELKTIGHNTSSTNYTYDSLDRLRTETLPNSETITYNYSSQNQLSTIQGILNLTQHNAFNKPVLRAYSNDLNTSFTYDFPTSRLTRIYTSNLQDLNYQYDNVSNIMQIQDTYNSILQTMDYDKLNRLIYARRTDNSPQKEDYLLNYSYSSIGNILTITENNGNTISNYTYQNSPVHAPNSISQTGPIISVENLRLLSTNATLKVFGFHIKNNGNQNISNINFTFFTGVSQINSTIPINLSSQESILVYLAYNYSNSSEYKIIARAGNLTFISQQSLAIGQNTSRNASNLTQSFLYDANGNMVQDSQSYYEYNSFNQLSKIRDGNSTGTVISEYLYDSDGNRIRKSDRIKNETVFYINPNFLRVINATGTYDTIYYYTDSQLIARKDPDGKKYFYHPDHLGSTTLVTNESGAVVEDTNYKPFGEPLYDAKSRFLYTGKEQDSESGLMYYGARYYSPNVGRFYQPDPMIQFPYAPQSLNRYSYVQNNPYKFTDESGNFITLPAAVIGAVVGGALGAAISAGTQYMATGQVNLADVGRAAVVGGVAGGVAGLTGCASLLATVGSSVASGRAAQVAENALTGQDLTQNLLDPGGIGFDIVLGGVGHGVGKALSGSGNAMSVTEGEINSGSKSTLRGAANPNTREAIVKGMAEHQKFYNIMGEKGMITNKAIPGYRIRPDAIDLNNRVIYELKPEGRVNLKSTRDQVSGYIDAAKNADWSKYGKPADWGKSGAWSFEIVPYR